MSALTAPLQHVEASDSLLAIPLFPLLAAAANGFFGARVSARGPRTAMTVGLAGTGAALALAASAAWSLAGREADNRHMIAPIGSFAHVGELSATVGLAADPLALSLVLVVALVALAAHFDVGFGGHPVEHEPGRHAAISALAGALFVAFLGDGFPTLLLGLSGASLATVALLSPARAARRAWVAAYLEIAAIVVGAAVIFWTLGGSWGIALGHEPTYTVRRPMPLGLTAAELELDDRAAVFGPSLLPVTVGAPAAPAGKTPRPPPEARGHLTMTAWPGARIFLKGATQPSTTSPVIAYETYAGRVDVEVELDPRQPHVVLRALEIPVAGYVELVPLGPTLSFREIEDQFTLLDGTKQRFVRNLFDPTYASPRRIGGVSASTIAALCFALAALARASQIGFFGGALATASRGVRALLLAATSLAAVYLVARTGSFFALSSVASSICVAVFALAALPFAKAALDAHSADDVAASVVASQTMIALAGAAAIGFGAATLHVVSVGLSAAAWAFAYGRPRGEERSLVDRAPLFAAAALAGAPVVLLGAGWSREAVLQRLFAVEAPFALGKIGWALALLASIACAFAVLRCELASAPQDDAEDAPGPTRIVAFALAAVALFAAPVLGVSQKSLLFGPDRPLADVWLAPDLSTVLEARGVRPELGRGVSLAIAAITMVLAVVAWVLARKRPTMPAKPRQERLPALFDGFAEGLGAVFALIDFALDLPLRAVSMLLARRARSTQERSP